MAHAPGSSRTEMPQPWLIKTYRRRSGGPVADLARGSSLSFHCSTSKFIHRLLLPDTLLLHVCNQSVGCCV